MTGPLHGIRVLDLTAMVSGPVAATMLADQGADVVKVEPVTGELVRHMGKPHNGVSAVFWSCNRGKRSLALDLKSEQGRTVLRDLIAGADVLLQNFRPGAMARMGFPDEDVMALNPRLVYVSISGFGEHGPYAHQRVYDPVIQALSGATDIQANRETGRPAMFRIIIADKVTAVTAAQAVAAALFHRERTGEGQHVKLSMLDTMVAFFWPEGMSGLVFKDNEYDVKLLQGTMDLVYRTKDGWITAGVVSDKEWKGMCTALGREDLLDDPRFATTGERVKHTEVRKAITAEEIEKWETAEILARLDANDVPNAPLLTRMELMDHPQIEANGIVEKVVHPGFGEVRQARPAAHFSASPAGIAGPAPQLGEHSTEVLRELGYDAAQCQALVDAGVVVQHG